MPSVLLGENFVDPVHLLIDGCFDGVHGLSQCRQLAPQGSPNNLEVNWPHGGFRNGLQAVVELGVSGVDSVIGVLEAVRDVAELGVKA